MTLELQVWAEKYRPSKLNDVINQGHVVERLAAFAKDKNIPHLLLAGPAGSGKTTCAIAIAKEIYGNQWKQNVLELNSSDERGIDVMRSKAEQKDESRKSRLPSVKDFARTRPFGDAQFRIIILDEADALTPEAQQALRRTMEDFSATARFILICNYSSKLIEPIQSRCAVFRFKALAEADIKKFIDRIVKGEKLNITSDGINAIIYIAEGDLRKVGNLLQAASSLGEKITEDVVYDIASKAKPTDVRVMLEFVINGNFMDARKKLQELLLRQGLNGQDIISEIHRQLYSLDGISEDKKLQMIEKCGEYEFRLSEGASELIQLEALLSQFLLVSRK